MDGRADTRALMRGTGTTRKAYEAPALTLYGSLADLTATGNEPTGQDVFFGSVSAA